MSEAKMPMDDRTSDHLRDIYPSNSKLQPPRIEDKIERREVKSVVDSKATVQKEPLLKRFIGLFVSEDAQEIKRYLKDDLIIPSIKTGILSALEMIFFHHTSGYGYWRPTDYTKTSQRPTTYSYGRSGQYTNAGQVKSVSGGVKSILYKTRMDAERVLMELNEQISMYGEATVMEFYTASDIDSSFTDAKWGWKDLSGARIYPAPGGFTIQMPKVIPLE